MRAAAPASSPREIASGSSGGLSLGAHGGNLSVHDAERILGVVLRGQILLPLGTRPQFVLGDIGRHTRRLRNWKPHRPDTPLALLYSANANTGNEFLYKWYCR